MKSTITELYAYYDSAISFYGKATRELFENGSEVLTSYKTQMVKYDSAEMKMLKLSSVYSQTTMRHINEFLADYGRKTLTKAEWLAIAVGDYF